MTRHLNDTSVTDICEIGGDFATMRDVHYVLRGQVLELAHQVDDGGEGLVGQWLQRGVGGPPLRVWKHARQGVDGGRGGARSVAVRWADRSITHAADLHVAAVAGDADNINKQARKMRTN